MVIFYLDHMIHASNIGADKKKWTPGTNILFSSAVEKSRYHIVNRDLKIDFRSDDWCAGDRENNAINSVIFFGR